jgi:diguanylate cyclase (GGDEF)-like protein
VGGRAKVLFAFWLLLTVASAGLLLHVQAGSRSDIEARFQLRAEVTSNFVDTYAADFLNQERGAAKRELAGRAPSRKAFDRVAALLDAKAAVLLDGKGDALQVAPHDPALIGVDLAAKYDHLRSAVSGTAAISNVVPSASKGIPIVAFATPYPSADGRRVFSGAFDIRSTPLADYLGQAALAPNQAYLVDASGALVGTTDPTLRSGTPLPAALAGPAADASAGGVHADGNYVVSQPITGTPWRLVLVAPEDTLYAAISGLGEYVPWMFWLGFAAGGLLSVWLVSRLLSRRKTLAALNKRLQAFANIDVLTELANRRHSEEALASALALSKRFGDPLSVLMIDVDSFKQINDSFGHATGDAVLRWVAAELTATLREVDTPGRWGGDEFVAVLPRADSAGAQVLADRFHRRINDGICIAAGEPVDVSVSIGCAEWDGEEAEALIHRADEALYLAKANGRDQVATAAPATTAAS